MEKVWRGTHRRRSRRRAHHHHRNGPAFADLLLGGRVESRAPARRLSRPDHAHPARCAGAARVDRPARHHGCGGQRLGGTMARSRLTARGRAIFVLLAMLIAAATAAPLAAQDADTTQSDDDTTGVDETDGDSSAVVGQAAAAVIASYAVPDMPAAAFLGTTPATITRPATARDFLLGLASGVDEHGQARQGFALEASPSAIVPGFGVSLDAYRAPGFNPRYLLANLLVSLGAARA